MLAASCRTIMSSPINVVPSLIAKLASGAATFLTKLDLISRRRRESAAGVGERVKIGGSFLLPPNVMLPVTLLQALLCHTRIFQYIPAHTSLNLCKLIHTSTSSTCWFTLVCFCTSVRPSIYHYIAVHSSTYWCEFGCTSID